MNNNQKIINAIDQAIKSKSEKPFLDFKVQWHNDRNSKDKASLIHDILALSNCDYKDERYLVIGVEDKTFNVKGVVEDQNRKNTENLTTLMRDSNFNKIPNVEVREVTYQNSVLDVVIIKYDNSYARPFYIEELTNSLQKELSAGAIYSRNNDTNTPKNRTANKFEIEKMWREHFGIDKSVLERFKIYLDNPSDWEKCDDGYYYKYSPEFVVFRNYDWNNKSSFLKADLRSLADFTDFATMHEVGLRYHSTILFKNNSAEIDNYHTSIMHPEHTDFDENGEQSDSAKYLFFYVFEECFLYRISKFLIAKDGCERPNGVFCYDISEFNPRRRFIFVLKGNFEENYQNIRATIRKLSQNREKMNIIKNDSRFIL